MKFQWSKDPYHQLLQIVFFFGYTPATIYLIRLWLNFGYAITHGYWAYEP